ncbi:hypothetical protein CSOJ01_09774 [Colletotrichum sojae]|uniref:Uncharacterized protein n=1 Tax=Colletotrichum sojae TaxID=2175907 RepID=A0A8H6MQY1_9PEZI|nr:hypothetical protein CSOJ01_09774 [Colletotrichum sojae]
MNNGNGKQIGGPGNSSNPRPGQSPFPNSNALVRQTTIDSQSSQPYTSSYSNNFDRSNSRYSTGRTEEDSRNSQENYESAPPPRSPPRRQPKQEQAGRAWEDSIYGMYGDLRTPREAPPPPRQNQQQRRQYQQDQLEDEDSYDEEVPRRPDPEPQRPRYSRSRTSPGPETGPQRRNTTRQNQRGDRQDRQDRRERREQQDNRARQDQQNGDGNARRVHINIDTGGDGGRSWSFSTDEPGRANVNFGSPFGGPVPSLVNFGTPFGGDSGFPFGGRGNNGGRLPVNIPFGGGINLPFGL